MARRDLAKDATLTLPGVARPVGRPRTGCAKTAAERMRAYRARRAAQAAEFPSPVTEIPDEWELPVPAPAPTPPVHERQMFLQCITFIRNRRTGNPYQQHLARMSMDYARWRLFTLGGLASVW